MKLSFKAVTAHASKNTDGHYYMIGLADDEADPANFLIAQKSYDPDSEGHDLEICVGSFYDADYNCCKQIVITPQTFKAVTEMVELDIDISGLTLSPDFLTYTQDIFGDLVDIKA